ncbi:hypothetical protein KY290_023045 [Solanum tuberosum]|uniref:CCHC-type domain-containing protein n=1 Tax=Solanum tuberosum TaxID=4113 RepID=A0ABQ7V660_SOLTU|nr:hypothetical protein KY284_021935 [Solanum tuberosum]KAH0684328.1 hypothetical protein KY289_022080 [Solanum tuberosum]KAH0694727.1 hypothetical protein KY285_021824 [Solanum tuberosum]KAH0759552.1 hypothetical protein KY290_023045 [Solanum tuberosum]
MSCNTCHKKGHNKRKCPLGTPASGTTVGPSSGPAAAPTSTQTASPTSTPNAPTGRGRGRPKGSTENDSVASKTRMVGMGPGMPSERFRNVKSSIVVTGDLGHKPTCGVKWKRKQSMTSSQLEEMRGRKQMETRSKAAHLSQKSSNAI